MMSDNTMLMRNHLARRTLRRALVLAAEADDTSSAAGCSGLNAVGALRTRPERRRELPPESTDEVTEASSSPALLNEAEAAPRAAVRRVREGVRLSSSAVSTSDDSSMGATSVGAVA